MRRSFGGSSGMGMGRGGFGGSNGGGGMFRTLTRVRTSSFSTSSPTSSSSSFSTCSSRKAPKRSLSIGTNSAPGFSNSVVLSDEGLNLGFDPSWVWVDDESSETEIDSFDDCVFGSVPSPFEAHAALHSLRQSLPTSRHSDSDWNDPSLYPYGCEQSICPSIGRVYDAFHLLQTDPSIQRMVISLSSDRAVWNAVFNNPVVQEFREAFRQDEENVSENPGDDPNPSKSPTNVLSWIFNNMRSKFMDFLEGITTLMTNMFQPPCDNNHQENLGDGFGELVKSAFMLTAIVLLIVVVTRASHA